MSNNPGENTCVEIASFKGIQKRVGYARVSNKPVSNNPGSTVHRSDANIVYFIEAETTRRPPSFLVDLLMLEIGITNYKASITAESC